jgi:hypothetical protein
MLLRTWRFVTIMLTALALAAALAHLMEMPGKMTYDAALYVKLHRTLYPTFGRTAGWAEGLALFSVLGLAWRVRKREAAFPLTLAAAACQLAAMAAFLIFVHPANLTMSGWPLDAVPPEWTRWRDQWEYAHAARAFLQTGTLAALVLSVLLETPEEPVSGHAAGAPAAGRRDAHADPPAALEPPHLT